MCWCRPEVKTPWCGKADCVRPGYQPTSKLDTSNPPQGGSGVVKQNAERIRRRGGTLRVPFRFLVEMLKLPPNVELVGVRPTVYGFDETAEFMLSGAGLPDECEVEPGVIYPNLTVRWRVESETVFDGFTVLK